MSNKYFYVTLMVILFFANSCKKSFLEVENTERLFRETYVKDLSSMQQYLNGAYYLLAVNFEDGMAVAYPELVADNLRPLTATGSNTRMLPHYNWNQISDGRDNAVLVGGSRTTSNAMDPLWRSGYTIVRMCNFIIENIGRYRNENPTKGDDLKGQALAIRAYILFKLVNTFAQPYNYTSDASHKGIPYIATADITKPFSRVSVAEVYSGIIKDLKDAIPLLPSLVTDIRYMNYNAARGILARVYLYTEDYGNALSHSQEIINQLPLMSISQGYPDNLFKFRSPSETEVMFQLSPEGDTYFLGVRLHSPSNMRFVATNDIADILIENPHDIRKNWIKDTIISGTNFRMVKKFPKGVAPEVRYTINPLEIAYYPPIVRSSEIYLTLSESAAKLGDENLARLYLDAIRQRANPSIPVIKASGKALLDSIYKERRKELSFEGLRMYDVQRNKQSIHRSDVLPGSPSNLSIPNDKAIAPIPLRDVQLAGLTQNKSY